MLDRKLKLHSCKDNCDIIGKKDNAVPIQNENKNDHSLDSDDESVFRILNDNTVSPSAKVFRIMKINYNRMSAWKDENVDESQWIELAKLHFKRYFLFDKMKVNFFITHVYKLPQFFTDDEKIYWLEKFAHQYGAEQSNNWGLVVN